MTARPRGKAPALNALPIWLSKVAVHPTALLFPIGVAVTLAAFFLPRIPFALACLPLATGLWVGTRRARFMAMTSFMLWPVLLSAWGVYGLDVAPTGLIWTLAALMIIALGFVAARIGLVATTVGVTLIPTFPASPLLLLAALLPELGPFSLAGVLIALGLLEALRRSIARQAGLGLIALGLMIWSGSHALFENHPAQITPANWSDQSEPRAFSTRGRWIALRDSLPDNSTVIFGENVFAAQDGAARAFWCRAVLNRNLTLLTGVAEPYGAIARSAVWRLDSQTCADLQTSSARPLRAPVIQRAALGIPGLTGTWGPMQAPDPVRNLDPGLDIDWLICLEAFLPQAWAGLLLETVGKDSPPRPFILLANDTAFRPLPVIGHPPVHILRRKAAAAMAGLVGRPVFFAETGRRFLISPNSERTAS